VLNNAGQASLALVVGASIHKMATRSATGTWNTPMVLPGWGVTAIDGAGDIITIFGQDNASGIPGVYDTRLAAGSST